MSTLCGPVEKLQVIPNGLSEGLNGLVGRHTDEMRQMEVSELAGA